MAMTLAPPGTRALMVPDWATWAAFGVDVQALGFDPVPGLDRAEALVVPESLPSSLAASLAEVIERLPVDSVRTIPGAPLGGEPLGELLARVAHARTESEEDGGGSGHDHGDMMAVTGDPSEDGLVMEDAKAMIGPIGGPFPTGLQLELTLDGDVVCEMQLESALGSGPGPLPDPFSRKAAEWALRRGPAAPALAVSEVAAQLLATELERALSHSIWLAGLCELIGWAGMADRLRSAVAGLIEAHAAPEHEAAALLTGRVTGRLSGALASYLGSDSASRRLKGVAHLSPGRCAELGIKGPNARACGLPADARSADPAYTALGFEPVVGEHGDAAARARLRAEEALASIELIERARQAGELPEGAGPVEGPRGRVHGRASGEDAFALDGGSEGEVVTLERGALGKLVGELATGYGLARSLVAVSSFDLSPWELGS